MQEDVVNKVEALIKELSDVLNSQKDDEKKWLYLVAILTLGDEVLRDAWELLALLEYAKFSIYKVAIDEDRSVKAVIDQLARMHFLQKLGAGRAN